MNAYEVWGAGYAAPSVLGRIIYGDSPADALRRSGIPFKRRVVERTAWRDYPPYGIPSKYVTVHCVNFSEDGKPYHAAGFAFIKYEV